MFVDMVAAQRGADTDTVLSKMADGKIFIGKKAVDAGLIDGISTFKGALTYLREEKPNKKEVKGMDPVTLERFKTESPDEYKKLVSEVKEQAREEFQPELDEKDKEIEAVPHRNDCLKNCGIESTSRIVSRSGC